MQLNADRIRTEIYKQGQSQRKFAEEVLGIWSCQFYTMLKKGKCSAFMADCIATGLGLDISEILLDEPKKPAAPVMKVKLDLGAKITRAHEFDAGLDLYAREDILLAPCSRVSHDTGVHVAIPQGFVGLITSKSGYMQKYGVTCRGTIDYGYTGSIKAVLFNHGRENVYIRKGQKITQLVIMPILLPELELVDSLEDTERGDGGFGSSCDF